LLLAVYYFSIRAQFGSDVKANAVHGPSTAENAQLVIGEIFGDVKTTQHGKLDRRKCFGI